MGSDLLDNTLRGLIGESFIYFGLAAIGLNIHFGYTGLLNFGQAVFMAAGAYGLAMMVVTIGPKLFGWTIPTRPPCFWFGVFVGDRGVPPAARSRSWAFPTLRLRADYLAIVTIAVAEIFRLYRPLAPLRLAHRLLRRSQRVRLDLLRPLVRSTVSERYFFDLFTGNQMFLVLVGWVVVAIVAMLVLAADPQPVGTGAQGDPRGRGRSARSLGKNAYSYKMQALIARRHVRCDRRHAARRSASQLAQPDNFITDVTFFVWVALILGGAGKVLGPVLGAAIFFGILNFTDSFLREAVANDVIPESVMDGTQVGQVRFMLVGLGLILLAAFRPQGILGSKEEMALDDR